MENVTKALIMAAGILLSIMILSLLVIFGSRLSGYFSQEHDSKIIEQDTKFNAQFENYNQETIRGNELMSVMNKVVNYNTEIADTEKYEKVIMSVDFKGKQDSFKYNSSDTSIFSGKVGSDGSLKNTQASDNNLSKITSMPTELPNQAGVEETQLQRLAAELQNIDINTSESGKVEQRDKKLKSILGRVPNSTEITNIIKITKQYYQYTQLKRAMFTCKSVGHNTNQTGARVNSITFEIVVENGNVKFE